MRTAKQIDEVLATVNKKRVALDRQIADRRERLASLNSLAADLEREKQQAVARESAAEAASE